MGAADRLIAAAAAEVLRPFGLVRKGRSRTWIDDHGWWLINVEFQPSSGRDGCYLNIGDQHLWTPHRHLVFERMERPLGSTTFLAHDGDDAAFARDVHRAARRAAEVIGRRRDAHGQGRDALVRLAASDDDLNAGIAAALLTDEQTARTRLTRNVHPSDREAANRYLGVDAPSARGAAVTAIRQTRANLRLPPLELDWW